MQRIALIISLLVTKFIFGQVSIERNFNLELAEKDSITSSKLEQSLNVFLNQAKERSYTSAYVDTAHQKEFEFFFSKLAGIGTSASLTFHDPLIVKSYPIEDGSYRITVAFTGLKNEKPFLYQLTELKAVPYQDHYRFYCPFEENTTHFKTKTIGHITYHYSTHINEEKATSFTGFSQQLAELTHTNPTPLDYYAFKDLDELLKSYGFLYSARQCNFLCYDLGFTDNGGNTYITGTGNENYVFGYIGDYLYYNLPANEQLYWPFVQGIATYYGGYGLSYEDLTALKKQFREELATNPDINFLDEFKKGRKSSVNRHFSYYVMSAFIFQEVVEKHGFDEAIKLAYAGSKGEQFFELLDEVAEINEANFHESILRMIS